MMAAIQETLKGVEPKPRRINRGFVMRLGTQTSLDFNPGCEYPIEDENILAAKASLDVTTLTDDQAMERIVREVIPHEIGHTLGLRHNFKASADVKNLTDGAPSTTVMDYQNSLASLTEPGPYDYAAIAYAYDGDKSLYEGKSFFFATDGSNAVDPLSNQFDEGDPLTYYTGRYAHFAKLRDAGFFPSLASYGRAQRRTLEVIRKFVNRGEQSKAAFDFLLKALTEKSPTPPFSAIERLQAMLVLTEPAPAGLARFNPRAQYQSLDDAEEAALAQGLVTNVVPDGKDIFEVRLAMVETLKARNNIYGYKALEAISKAYDKATAQGADGAQAKPLPPREQELALRIKQAVSAYFNK
ncbi:MAG: zinc-dependent metalloprotease [Candidatus Wallbacteria bacterium]|nr:zinc-dependent metalloprotease [Candidatus Wallbacteria bacterium]